MSDDKCDVCGNKDSGGYENRLQIITTPDNVNICEDCLLKWAEKFGDYIPSQHLLYLKGAITR